MKEILLDEKETNALIGLLLGTKPCPSHEKLYSKLITKLENSKKKIKTSSAKAKGRNLQYWVCERLSELFGCKFDQSDDSCLIQSRPMGQHGTDIILREPLSSRFPFDIECKACEKLSIPDWVRQAKANTKKGKFWLLVFRKKTLGNNPVVLMDWETLEKLYKGEISEKNR